jgi:1-deoxy-D-xylulose-5-phosphate reductoisomerase
MAGGIITKEAKKSGINIIPVDSEHSAIFQVLNQSRKDYVKRIILTASGGPLHNTPEDKLRDITPDVALNHPTWKMGRKISIDSATLMNKGFEVIEAKWLFGIKPESIAVWIHPQSIVHSMVEYIDGSIIAQMSSPNMKIPIAYALSYPERIQLDSNEISPIGFKELTFEDVNFDKFPALRVAYSAIEIGGTMPAVMSAANEEAVEAFLMGRIKFIDILRVVKKVMDSHKPIPGNSLEEIIQSDRWARDMSSEVINNIGEILQ